MLHIRLVGIVNLLLAGSCEIENLQPQVGDSDRLQNALLSCAILYVVEADETIDAGLLQELSPLFGHLLIFIVAFVGGR